MKFGLDSNTFARDIMLNQENDVIKSLAKTQNRKNPSGSENFDIKILINDVEIPWESIEVYFHDLFGRMGDHYREMYKCQESEVQKRLEKRMQQEVQPVLDKLENIREVLSDASSIIKPYWER